MLVIKADVRSGQMCGWTVLVNVALDHSGSGSRRVTGQSVGKFAGSGPFWVYLLRRVQKMTRQHWSTTSGIFPGPLSLAHPGNEFESGRVDTNIFCRTPMQVQSVVSVSAFVMVGTVGQFPVCSSS